MVRYYDDVLVRMSNDFGGVQTMSMSDRFRAYQETFDLTYPLTARENDVITTGGLRYLKVGDKVLEYGFNLFDEVYIADVTESRRGYRLEPVRFSELEKTHG